MLPLNFISVCGLEGSGKTSTIKTLTEELERAGFPTSHPVRSPGGTPFAEAIRHLHKSNDYDEHILPETELYLMAASFMQSYHHQVLPVLAENKVVIGDRNYWCTYAYQIHERCDDRMMDIYRSMVNRLEAMAPMSHVIYLDVTPEIGIERARGRGELDRLEHQDIAFFHRARAGYHTLAETHSASCTVINADGDLASMLDNVREAVRQLVV